MARTAFNGDPGQVDNAVGLMHQLDGHAQRVLACKLDTGPGKGKHVVFAGRDTALIVAGTVVVHAGDPAPLRRSG